MWNKCRTQGLYKKSGVPTPYPWKPEQMVCGVSALGGQGPSLGGVGRSAHQMTSYPSIDFFFIVDSSDLLTQGDWTMARAHVPAFEAHRRMVGGSGEEPQQSWRYPSDHRSSAGHNWCILWGQQRQSFELFLPIDFFLADPGWPCRTSGELALASSKLARWLGLIRLRQTWSDLTQGWP